MNTTTTITHVSDGQWPEGPFLHRYSDCCITMVPIQICPTCRGDGRVVYWAGAVPLTDADIDDYAATARWMFDHEDVRIDTDWWGAFPPRVSLCRTCGGQRVVEVTEVTDVPR